MPRQRGLILALTLACLAATLVVGAAPARAQATCQRMHHIRVPGAEQQKVACLPDLTTAYTTPNGYSVLADWSGLNDARTVNPTGVPGIQVDGYFPDTPPPAPYTPNPNNGWNHDAQFVIRLPDHWNGKLVIAPPPGNRRQYSSDFIIGDWVLARGYAFASTDKGNWNVNFYLDGEHPGDAVAEWHERVSELTRAARRVVRQRYGHHPQQIYLFGISNGGYQVRHAIEHSAGLYAGGVDWEGTLFTRDGPNLFTYLPTAIKQYGVIKDPVATPEAKAAAEQAMLDVGFAPGSQLLWPIHDQIYWTLTQSIYRQEFDPTFTGSEADYDYASRPYEVKAAVASVSLDGRIKRPLITVQGTLDSLLPPATNADPYVDLIAKKRRSHLHRYYQVESGQHVDGFVPAFGDALRPVLPCARAAFEALEQWVEGDTSPPPSQTIPRDQVTVSSCTFH